MPYYVLKNGQQSGPFSLVDLQAHLRSGAFAYTDLYWCEGMKDWTPLSALAVQAPKAPLAARIVTAIVLFFVFFILIYFVVAIVAFMLGGAISGAQAAAAANASGSNAGQGFSQGYSIGLEAGQRFRHDYGGMVILGSLIFSLVTAPILAFLTAFSNLLPWCRKH